MSIAAMLRETTALLETVRAHSSQLTDPLLVQIRSDPANILRLAGMEPDAWQMETLRSDAVRTLLLCSRQAGKSLTAGALALRSALLEAPALVLLLSRAQRQSAELFRDKVLPLWRALGSPAAGKTPTALSLELANGSRIVCLPGDEETIRGYSGVRLLVIDEAARVPDSLYYAVRPMLSVSRGRLVALTTPKGMRGWFYNEWTGEEPWQRVCVKAYSVPRISREFLEEEERALGCRWFQQEYLCSFESIEDAAFDPLDVLALPSDEVKPLPFWGR